MNCKTSYLLSLSLLPKQFSPKAVGRDEQGGSPNGTESVSKRSQMRKEVG